MPKEDKNPLEYVLEQIAAFQAATSDDAPKAATSSTTEYNDLKGITGFHFHNHRCTCRRCPRCGGYLDDWQPYRDWTYPYPIWCKDSSGGGGATTSPHSSLHYS